MQKHTKKSPLLSKSRYLAGLQCPLRLWYQCYDRQLAREVAPGQQALFDTGHEVGELATRLYPQGRPIKEEYYRHAQAVNSTQAAMDDPDVKAIFEAAFVFSGVRVRVDVLERLENESWNLVEVKSSTSAKEVHLPDVAVQYYVLQGCGLTINRAGILHINNQYAYNGNHLDLESLFSFADLTEDVVLLQEDIPSLLNDFKGMLARKSAPTIAPSRHCKKPYECEFWDHCTQDMPEYWVFGLSGIGQNKLDALRDMGVLDIRDVPDSFDLSQLQERIKKSVISQDEYLGQELDTELNDVAYPVHFLDFETTGSALPRYAGTRPYQTIAFQWSDHILAKDGTIAHQEYLCGEDKDPREEFSQTLIDVLGNQGSIFIYTTYEIGVMQELADFLPQFKNQLIDTFDRFKDLCDIIRNYYYHPKFYGSFSLKSVLPALLPEMSYKNLAIQEGNQASLEYLKMIDPATPANEKARIRKDLLTYCGQDTLSMVKIRATLLGRI
jgi:hypothetical protein